MKKPKSPFSFLFVEVNTDVHCLPPSGSCVIILLYIVSQLSLFLFGGEVIKGFTFAMMWGVIVGTYSSVFVASPVLIYLGVHRGTDKEDTGT